MAQSATLRAWDRDDGRSDLVRRLLARGAPARRTAAPAAAMAAPASDHEAAILVLKAALRAERAEVAALEDELAVLRAAQEPLQAAIADRDRWASLVERLTLSRG